MNTFEDMQVNENIWTLISASLLKDMEQTAWICRLGKGRERIVSYGEIYRSALRIAADLRTRGVEKGDRVGLMAPNGPEWNAAALAIWKVDAVLTPIHVGNSDHEIEQQIEALTPKLILSHQRAYAETDVPIVLEGKPPADEREAEIEPGNSGDDEAVAIYTSGSTGNPKIVRLSHRNITSNVVGSAKLASPTREDRFLALLPFSHAMGLTGVMLLALHVGSTLVAPRVLAAAEILEAMRDNRISILVAVPRLFRNIMLGLEKRLASGSVLLRAYVTVLRASPLFLRRYLNKPIRRQLGGKLNCWMSGGSRLDPEIKRYFLDLGISLRQGYGLTETSPVVSAQGHFDRTLDSVGPPIEKVEVRIDSPDDIGCGELLVRGPNVMLGYTDADYTAEVLRDGWFHTGDLARIDDNGHIVLTGRSKRLIVTESGKNVYPEELETLLERDPEIKEAAVLELDMRPAAVLVIDGEERESTARRILKEFNAKVSGHNQIARFALIDELPRTPLGKVALNKLPMFFHKNEVSNGSAR
jgi:long-chain acyl-CoA synthetase